MNRFRDDLSKGIMVTVGSLITAALAFAGYFFLFRVLERFMDPENTYNFVSWARVGYGLFWLVLAFLVYQTRLREWGKAVILAGALTTFMAAVNVQYYQRPLMGGVLSVLVVGSILYFLIRKKKEWFHYYAVAIAVALAWFYM